MRRRLKLAFTALLLCAAISVVCAPSTIDARPRPISSPTPQPQAAVINVNIISAQRAAETLRAVFPGARIRVDRAANAVIVVAAPDALQQMRSIVQGIDVRNPAEPVNQVVPLHFLKPSTIVGRLHALYPAAHIEIASKDSLLVRASPQDVAVLALGVAMGRTASPPSTAACPNLQIPRAQDLKDPNIVRCKECRDVEVGKPRGTRIYVAIGYYTYLGLHFYEPLPLFFKIVCRKNAIIAINPMTKRSYVYPRMTHISLFQEEFAIAPGQPLPKELQEFLRTGVAHYERTL